MTIPVAPRKSGPYTGNGVTTVFDYDFKIIASTDLKVILTVVATGVETVLDSSLYTVSGAGAEAGGSITYPLTGDPIASTHTITIIGNTEISQAVDISNSGDFYPVVHEGVFDKLTMIAQQQQEEIDRCVKLTASSTADPDAYITTIQGYVADASGYATAASGSAAAASGYADDASDSANAALVAQHACEEIAAVGNFPYGTFTGDGSTVDFDLYNGATEINPGTVGRVLWIEGGVLQRPATDFTLSGNTITRTTAPALGVDITWIVFGAETIVNVPSDLSVTEGKIGSGAVTATKIGSGAVTLAKLNADVLFPLVAEGRLTLTSGVPVTISDVTGATTIYYTPYIGNRIALYDGTAWHVRAFTETAIALGTLTASLPYDVFCYDNSGTPAFEKLAWTSATARATALVYQDGVLVKSGATTRRYIGTFYTTSTTTTEDSVAKRYLWNYYNRVCRRLSYVESAASWTYSTYPAYQVRNNSDSNKLFFVSGLAEDEISVLSLTQATSSTATVRSVAIAIGLDSATSRITGTVSNKGVTSAATDTLSTFCEIAPQIGAHYVSALERGNGTDTQTWYGSSEYSSIQAKIFG